MVLSDRTIGRLIEAGRIGIDPYDVTLDAPDDPETVAEWLKANPEPRVTLAMVADHIDHIARVAGHDHVGLGGDYDGLPALPEGMEGVESYPPLLAATLIFFAAAFDRLTGGGIAGLVVAALAVLAALLSHPFGLTLLPALLYLIVYRPGLMTSARLWRAAVIGAAAAAAAVALLALVFALNPGLRADNQPLRFLAPQEQLYLGGRIARHLFEHRAWSMKYGVLSWPQLADVLNLSLIHI